MDLNRLEDIRQFWQKQFLQKKNPQVIGLKITALMDGLLKYIWKTIGAEPYKEQVTILAIGGYGRREMSFYSDLDILILHTSPSPVTIEEKIPIFIQKLWDLKLAVDYSYRTIEECLLVAQQENSALVSMMTPRFLWGNRSLFEAFQKKWGDFIEEHAQSVINKIYDAYLQRHRHYSQHIYLLEPHIKEGIGGFRDFHSIIWAGMVKCKARNLEELCQAGLLLEREKRDLENAFDFLWLVRNYLHLINHREQDQLTFENQETISERLGFKDNLPLRAVEVFMQRFFKHSFAIKHISELFFKRLLLKSPLKKRLGKGIFLKDGHLEIEKKQSLAQKPEIILPIYKWAADYKANIGLSIKKELPELITSLDGWFAVSPGARRCFEKLLATDANLIPILEDMTYDGLMTAIIPEWQLIVHLPQYNLYHIYTVDVHSFHTLQEIKRLKAGYYKKKFPVFSEVAKDIRSLTPVLWAALLHDIGKGIGKPHEKTGEELTRRILSRWQMPDEEIEEIAWLVRHHLLLSHVAQRRDLDDEKVIGDVAKVVGSLERLKMLYVLSFADAKATGPRAFSDWKMALITELFFKVRSFFKSKGIRALYLWEKLESIKLELNQKFGLDRQTIENFPERYLLNVSKEEIAKHYQLIKELYSKPATLLWEKTDLERCFKVTILTWDFLGLFAKLAGIFSLNGFNILNVQAYTWKNKMALDIFWIEALDPYRLEEKRPQIIQDLYLAIEGGLDLQRQLKIKCQPYKFPKKVPRVKPEVRIDNSSSYSYTIVEVFTPDKPCLLFKLASCISKLKINIYLVRVSTSLDYAVDVFYLQELSGGKITDTRRLHLLKMALKNILNE